MLKPHQAIDFEEVFQVLHTNVFNKTQKRLKDVEKFVLWGAWEGKTYDEIAKASNFHYTSSYLKQDVGPKLWKLLSETLDEKVSKTNFRVALEQKVKLLYPLQSRKLFRNLEETRINIVEEHNSQEITEELTKPNQELREENCQMEVLLRIGKTVLARRREGQTQQEIESVVWHSLVHTPLFERILVELLQCLFNKQDNEILENSDNNILSLIEQLRLALKTIKL